MFGSELRRTTVRCSEGAPKAVPVVFSSGPRRPPASFDAGGALLTDRVDTIDWADRRPRSDSDVGSTSRARSSPWRLASRAMTRVMSRSVRE